MRRWISIASIVFLAVAPLGISWIANQNAQGENAVTSATPFLVTATCEESGVAVRFLDDGKTPSSPSTECYEWESGTILTTTIICGVTHISTTVRNDPHGNSTHVKGVYLELDQVPCHGQIGPLATTPTSISCEGLTFILESNVKVNPICHIPRG